MSKPVFLNKGLVLCSKEYFKVTHFSDCMQNCLDCLDFLFWLNNGSIGRKPVDIYLYKKIIKMCGMIL